jgi:hypothetical protein
MVLLGIAGVFMAASGLLVMESAAFSNIISLPDCTGWCPAGNNVWLNQAIGACIAGAFFAANGLFFMIKGMNEKHLA